MPVFSQQSLNALTTQVHPSLITLFQAVIKSFDCTVLDGVRTIEQQKSNVARGLSQTMNSKHLPQSDGLAHAVDVAPYPQRWDDPKWRDNQLVFAGYVLGVASQLGISIRWGGDWKQDNDPEHNGFPDLDHFELAEP